MEAVFKKIHEGLDLFNYYFSRHEASSNDSQREKLETDLKKEIKKLQKFRDQIKTWQLNDAMEATIAPQKLQEHRRLVEEAMECYKEVEKNLKMKSFSNQSIMLAALDTGEAALSKAVTEEIEFIEDTVAELNDQIEKLEEEYDRLLQKKARKNNLLQLEEQKQELENFIQRNNFHIGKLEECAEFLRDGKISPSSVLLIHDDLTFYVESNQEPDFIDDDSVYDEIFKEAKENHDRVISELEEEEAETSVIEDAAEPSTLPKAERTAPATSLSPSPSATTETPRARVTSATPKPKPLPVLATAESTSPAIIKTLKPAAAPTKPVGALKWSAAAAGSAGAESNGTGHSKNGTSNGVLEKKEDTPIEKKRDIETTLAMAGAAVDPLVPATSVSSVPAGFAESSAPVNVAKTAAPTGLTGGSKFVSVLQQSNVTRTELELFSDFNLVRVPPGIQDLIVSFTATRKTAPDAKLLLSPSLYNQYKTSIWRPYLPGSVQLSSTKGSSYSPAKPPVHLLKLQLYWNRIRAANQFEQFVHEIQLLRSQNNPENTAFVNELTMVLFYGLYYGLTPLEYLVAESCLFQLGWKPYGARQVQEQPSAAGSPGRLTPLNGALRERKQYFYWFRNVKSIPQVEAGETVEYGDYQTFDLHLWEIHVKYNFRFDTSLCQMGPSETIC